MAQPSKVASPPPRSATRVLDVLDALQDSPGGLGLRDIAVRTGMPKSTALRYLVTLVDRRYVDRDPMTGEYRIGLAVPSQPQYYERLTRAAQPFLERLRDEFGELTTLGILDRDKVALLAVVESPHVIQPIARVGERDYLHCTAIGKAILATLPEESLRRITGLVGLPARTERTITDMETLRLDLEQVRERGFAVTDGENHEELRGVAAAIPSSRVQGAVGMTVPAMRFELAQAEPVGERLCATAALIAESLA